MNNCLNENSKTDPIVLVFPGQGSQSPGMGSLIYKNSKNARLTFEEASDITNIDMAKICFEGTAEDLSETRLTQPAVLTASIAFLRAMNEKLEEKNISIKPKLLGGHSLGMFSAAVAAQTFSFQDALLMILDRARLMSDFNKKRPVGMSSILGLDFDKVSGICNKATTSELNRVDIANLNLDSQIVISGDIDALTKAMELARDLHARAIQLKVKVSSHTPLHSEQSKEFKKLIKDVNFYKPSIPIISNSTSNLLTSAQEIRHEFENQLHSPVYWTENVQRMLQEGIQTVIEVGPGHVLSRMAKKISGELIAVSLDDAHDEPIPISVLPEVIVS